MAIFITPQMFVGKYKLNTGMYSTTDIQAYIDKYEQMYLVQLMGADLYNEFLSDLNNSVSPVVPYSPNFLKIFNSFYENVSIFQLLYSEGLINMLLGFIYFEYTKDLLTTITIAGEVSQNAENSAKVSALSSGMWDRYNLSVKTYNTIQNYIRLNYGKEKGQIVSLYGSVVSNGTGYVSGTENLAPLSGLATTILLISGGTGYPNGTYTNQATSTNGAGTGLTVTYTVVSNVIVSLTLGLGGTGYKVGDLIYIVGGTLGYAQVTSAYPIITGTGTPKINIVAQGVGNILTSSIISQGISYVQDGDGVSLAGGSGSGATCDFTVTNAGLVNSVTIVNKGSGYQVGEVLTITAYTNTATISVDSVGNGEILSFTVNSATPNTTSGYKKNDIFEVLGTNGTKARVRVSYVGIGTYNDLNGLEKLFASWI